MQLLKEIKNRITREGLKMRGRVEFFVFDKEGRQKSYLDAGWNDITDAGFDLICDVIAKTAQPSDITHIGVGWGAGASDAFAAGQTDLQGASKDRNTIDTYNHSVGTKVFYVEAEWGVDDPIAGEVTVEESGCFNAASAGTMLNRKTFTGVVKGQNDTLKVKWTFTLS